MIRYAALAAVLAAVPALAQTVTPAPAAPTPTPDAVPVPEAVAEAVPPETIETLSYACADNKTMQVVYVNTSLGNSWAILLEQDEMIPMQVVPSASGAVYHPISPDYHYELLTKGRNADLTAITDGKEETVKADCSAS